MADTQYSRPSQHTLNLAELVKSSLFGFNARVAAVSTLETAAPSRQPVSVSPPYVNDEALIAEGHRQRREALAARRAEQQLQILLTDSQRLGVSLSTEVMARTVIAAYTDTLNCARR